MDDNDSNAEYSVETRRRAGFRALLGLLIATSLLNLGGCVAVPQGDRDTGRHGRSFDVAQRAAPVHRSSNPDVPSLDISRLSLHAALVVPDSVQAMIAENKVPMCAWGLPFGEIRIPVGELVASAAEELLSQVFVSVNLVYDHPEADSSYDVVVEMTSLVVQMQFDCPGASRDLKVRLMLGGKITDRGGQTLLGEASIERKQLPLASGYGDTLNVEVIRPALEQALLETMAGLVRRLAAKPKLIEYARKEATHKVPSAAGRSTPSPVITAPPIY